MRKLLVLAATVVFVETMFFAAVAPILPQLSEEFGLSKTHAGVLSGAYAVGTLLVAIPGGLLAAKFGPRRTVAAGLALMSLASLAFALGQHILLLDGARFVQGVGGAMAWAGAFAWVVALAPRERRGEMIGGVLAFAIGGVLFGPVLGGAAEALGRGPLFGAVAVGGTVLTLATVGLRVPSPAAGGLPVGDMLRALVGAPLARVGLWLTIMPGLVFGTLEVLVPLRFDELGAGAFAIAGAFIASAAVEAVVAPLAGRVSDRRGRLVPSAVGLAASAALLVLIGLPESALALAVLLILISPAVGVLNSPAMAMVADAAELARVPQGLAFGFINLGWGIGQMVGTTGGAALGEAAGDVVAYLALCAACLGTLAFLRSRWDDPTLASDVPAEALAGERDVTASRT
jgi:MFS family permease